MRGTQNWLLVEVLGRGATETGEVLVGATEIGPLGINLRYGFRP